MEGIFIHKDFWGCSNHVSVKARAKLMGNRKDGDQSIKVEKHVLFEKPFVNGSVNNGDDIMLILKEGGDRYSCDGKVVSLVNDNMSAIITSDESRDAIDELIKNINT